MPQPSTSGIVIPQTIDNSKYFENIDTNTSTIEAMLEMFFKFSQKDKERLSYQVEEMTVYQKELRNFAKPNLPEEKKKKGLNKYFDKWFVKKDFLKTLLGFFKNMLARAGNWLTTLLEALLFFAIFDPKGTFLASILDFITRMAVTLIQIIMSRLPGILKTMWKLFWNIIVPGFGRLGQAIGEALFGKDSAMSGVFEWLGKIAPVVVVLAGVIGKLWGPLTVLYNAYDWLSKLTFKKIFTKIFNFFTSLKNILFKIVGVFKTILLEVFKTIYVAVKFLLANPIILIVAAIIAAIALIWVYADEVANFFEVTIPKWFNSLGETMKALVGFIIIITSPIWGIFYGLAKLFQSFKKYGVKQTMQIIWEGMKKGAMALGKYLMSLPGKMWGSFKGGMNKLWDGFKGGMSKMWDSFKKGMSKIWSDLKNKLKQVGEYLLALPGRMWSSFKNSVSSLGSMAYQEVKDIIPKRLKDAIYDIKDFLSSISDWITAFMTEPSAYMPKVFGGSETARQQTKIAVQVQKEIEREGEAGVITRAALGEVASKQLQRGMSTEEILELIKSQGKSKEQTKTTYETVVREAKRFETVKRAG